MAMKCFKVVQKVLEDTYDEIGGDEDTRDGAITDAIRSLSSTYRNVLSSGGPDFTDPVTRFAYVYMYVPSHAHWVHELITLSPVASSVFDEEKVRIACIGGGPGSDLVGILKFLDERDEEFPAIFCEIVDGCEDWKATWSDLGFSLDLPGNLNTDYIIHRVGDPGVWKRPNKFAKADLITFSFFVSEITHLGAPAWAYVEAVLAKAKPGAVILLDDNNDSRFIDPFDEIAKKLRFEFLVNDDGQRKVYDPAERVDDLGRFRRKFDYTPRLTGNVAWRVLRKPLK